MLLRLRPLYFFTAFAIGLLFCYLVTPPPTVVVKFPSPHNAGRVIYKDDADSCFKFNAARVACKAGAIPQPIAVEGGGGGAGGGAAQPTGIVSL